MNLKNAIFAKLASVRASAELKKANSTLKQYKSILGQVNELRRAGLTTEQAVTRIASQSGKTVEQILGKADCEFRRLATIETGSATEASYQKWCAGVLGDEPKAPAPVASIRPTASAIKAPAKASTPTPRATTSVATTVNSMKAPINTITAAEFQQPVSQMALSEFNKLSPSDRMAFVKSGGKITK